MSMTSLPKHEDQHMESTDEKYSGGARTPPYAVEASEKVTLRSWLYAGLGCFLYFVISYNLAATSQWRSAQGAFLDPVSGSANSIWLLNCVSIFQACLGPAIMSISDIISRRYVLIVISAAAVAGAAMSARASSFDMALAGQCLASIGMATVGAGYAIPSEVMPRKWRGGVQCAVNLSASLGGGAGVLITGALLKSNPTEGWRESGYVVTALWAAFFLATLIGYHPPPRPTSLRDLSISEKLKALDWVGYFLLCAGLCLFLVGLTQGGNTTWTSASTLGPLISGFIVSIAFGVYEWKGTSTGLCHHELFKNRNYALSLVAVAIEGTIMFALLAFFGVAAQALWTQDIFVAAAYTSPFYLVSIPFFVILIWYTGKYKEFKIPLTVGYLLYLGAMIGLTQSDRNSGALAWGMVVMAGVGFSAPIALLVAVGQLATPGQFIGAASALLVSARAIGAAVSVAIYAGVLGSKLSHNIPDGIVAGAFKGGLQPQQAPSVFPQLIPAIASQNAEIIASAFRIPGVTPRIVIEAIHGMQDGFADGMKYVWIIGSVFSAVGVISIFFLKSSKADMNQHIDAPAQEEKHAHGSHA